MKRKNAMPAGRQGFTLIELLVSISIIAILTVLVSFSFSSAQKRARDSRRVMDMNTVQKAAELYYGGNTYKYPSNTAPWTVSTGETILPVFPSDPKGVGWSGYKVEVGTTGYCACAELENTKGGNSSSDACVFAKESTYFCVKNQQ